MTLFAAVPPRAAIAQSQSQSDAAADEPSDATTGEALPPQPAQLTVPKRPGVRHPLEPGDTSSPRATLNTFLDSMSRGGKAMRLAQARFRREEGFFPSDEVRAQAQEADALFTRALETLDVSKVPPAARESVAVEAMLKLKEVLDRVERPPIDEVPDAAEMEATGMTKWRLPYTSIVITQVVDGPRAGAWLFSPETVAEVPKYYQIIRDRPYIHTGTEGLYESYASTPGRLLPPKWLLWVRDLPQWMRLQVRNLRLWQWFGIAAVLSLGILVPYAVGRWHRRTARAIPEPRRSWRRLLVPIVALLSIYAMGDLITQQLNVTGAVINVIVALLVAAATVSLAFLGYLLPNAVAESIVASPKIDRQSLDANMVRMVMRIIGALLVLVMLFVGADALGIPLVTLLAGLGVGGFAVALAARPTLENLIGGIILFADRPVRVGDFCSFGTMMGTIESIGMRSTQIRAIDRTVISVPNAQFVDMQLVNWSRVDRMLVENIVRLRYDTTPEQVRFILARLREMVLAHPKLADDAGHVRLLSLGDTSIDVRLRAYALTADWNEFFAIKEDVLLRVIEIVEQSGTGLALPAQTLYLSRDDVIDAERAEAAQSQVQAWREEGELPFPEMAPARRAALRDSLTYPPPGSPDAPPPRRESGGS